MKRLESKVSVMKKREAGAESRRQAVEAVISYINHEIRNVRGRLLLSPSL